MKRSPEVHAVHDLMLACRRLESSLRTSESQRSEVLRQNVVGAMSSVLIEFGLLALSDDVAKSMNEFEVAGIPRGRRASKLSEKT